MGKSCGQSRSYIPQPSLENRASARSFVTALASDSIISSDLAIALNPKQNSVQPEEVRDAGFWNSAHLRGVATAAPASAE
jgi:hypothetical protein